MNKKVLPILKKIVEFPARIIVITLVMAYRMTLKPFMGQCCRYEPSCSQYMLDANLKYGPYKGTFRGIKRICRCHPWGGFGHDPA